MDKYKILTAEKKRLRTILDAHKNLSKTDNYIAIKASHDRITEQIKQIFRDNYVSRPNKSI